MVRFILSPVAVGTISAQHGKVKQIQRRSIIKMHALLNSFFFFCKPTGKPTDSGEHNARQKIPRQKIASGLYIYGYRFQRLLLLSSSPRYDLIHAICSHDQTNACHLISQPIQCMPFDLTTKPMHAISVNSQPIQCMPFDLTANPMHAI